MFRVHRPGDFSYKHDAKQKSVLVVANLRNPEDDSNVVFDLERALEHIKACKPGTLVLRFGDCA